MGGLMKSAILCPYKSCMGSTWDACMKSVLPCPYKSCMWSAWAACMKSAIPGPYKSCMGSVWAACMKSETPGPCKSCMGSVWAACVESAPPGPYKSCMGSAWASCMKFAIPCAYKSCMGSVGLPVWNPQYQALINLVWDLYIFAHMASATTSPDGSCMGSVWVAYMCNKEVLSNGVQRTEEDDWLRLWTTTDMSSVFNRAYLGKYTL